jgi:dTDP-glucose pyrophosphorylase
VAIVGIIPAAGYATRLQPIRSSQEVYPIKGKPVMNHLIERMRAARCSEIRVVTRPEKTDVVSNAKQCAAKVIFGHPPSLAKSIAMGLEGIADDDIVLLGFPDTIWKPADGFSKLVSALESDHRVALGLFRSREPERSDVVTLHDSTSLVSGIAVKPDTPSSDLIWGCAAARARAMRGLEESEWPSEHFDSLCRTRVVIGVWLSDVFTDIGTRSGLSQALT